MTTTWNNAWRKLLLDYGGSAFSLARERTTRTAEKWCGDSPQYTMYDGARYVLLSSYGAPPLERPTACANALPLGDLGVGRLDIVLGGLERAHETHGQGPSVLRLGQLLLQRFDLQRVRQRGTGPHTPPLSNLAKHAEGAWRYILEIQGSACLCETTEVLYCGRCFRLRLTPEIHACNLGRSSLNGALVLSLFPRCIFRNDHVGLEFWPPSPSRARSDGPPALQGWRPSARAWRCPGP